METADFIIAAGAITEFSSRKTTPLGNGGRLGFAGVPERKGGGNSPQLLVLDRSSARVPLLNRNLSQKNITSAPTYALWAL